MQPLFTIHAGEYLVAEHLERTFKNVRVWLPTKDTGIDILVTDQARRRTCALQVKYSKDYLVTHLPPQYQSALRACGWWVFNEEKLERSPADLWILLLVGFGNKTRDFIIVEPQLLLKRLKQLHPNDARPQSYQWVTQDGRCWETRGLPRERQDQVVSSTFQDRARDFTTSLNAWHTIQALNDA